MHYALKLSKQWGTELTRGYSDPLPRDLLKQMIVFNERVLRNPALRWASDQLDQVIKTSRGATPEKSSIFYFAGHWKYNGCPIFKLTPSLASALVLTDPAGVMGDIINLPFPAFVIHLPKSPFSLTFDGDGHRAPASYITVEQWQADTKISKEIYNAVGTARTIEVTEGQQVALSAGELVDHITQHPNYQPTEFWKHALLADNGADIHASKTVSKDELCADWALKDTALIKGDDIADDEDRQISIVLNRLLVNFCFYLQMKKGLPSPIRKKGSKGGYSIYTLGREVQLPQQMRDAAYSYAHAGVLPKQWKACSRFVVRGHWRNQHYGPNRSQQKRIWIQPFWKGPKTAEELERVYSARPVK